MKTERPPKQRRLTLTACILVGALVSAPALPHGGGLNSSGCHNDNVNGGYHCHRDGESSESLDSDVVLAVLAVSGVIYLVYRLKKNRRASTAKIGSSPLTLGAEMTRADPVRLDVVPAINSRGRIDGVGFNLRFRF